jgi:hypothetical protein
MGTALATKRDTAFTPATRFKGAVQWLRNEWMHGPRSDV